MRLICPNCGAQYEVPDDVIPAAGRDVQCSNCSHTWFENAPDEGAIVAPEPPASTAPVPRRPVPPPVVHEETHPDPADEVAQSEHAVPAEPVRRELDPAVANILRQEAEHERAQRETDSAPSLQSQTELALPQSRGPDEQRSEESRRRMARLKGEQAPLPATTGTGGRSDLLPDIEEINSTLRSSIERGDVDPVEEEAIIAKRKKGFRRGFTIIVLLAVLAALVYLYAPQISARVPAVEPVLTSYVNTVNEWRLWIDLKMQSFVSNRGDAAG